MTDTITMVFIQGMMFLGKMDGQKLIEPRQFIMFQNPQGQKMIEVEGLPGNPAFISVKDYGFYYPVQDEKMIALYVKATTGLELPALKAPALIHAMN